MGTLDYLQSLYDEHKKPELEFNAKCHDCGKPVKVVCVMSNEGELTTSGGAIYKKEVIEKPFFKCEDCVQKEPELRNFQSCEVYSRVCGYLRPVNQYNLGKKEEFKERVNYRV